MSTKLELEVDVQFGGVSIGDETARVGVKFDRARLTLDQADEFLCGKRLTGRIEVCAPGEAEGQSSLPGMEDERPHLDGTFDVKRFGVGLKEISCGLTFSLGSIDVRELARFAKKNGRLLIADAEFLPDDSETDESEGDESDDDHEDLGPLPKRRAPVNGIVPGDAGAEMQIRELVKFGIPAKKCAALEDACGGKTIGKLEKFMREDEWWHKNVKGLGDVWVTRVQDAHFGFRRQHPVPTDEPETRDLLDGPSDAATREVVQVPHEHIEAAYKAGCEAAVLNEPQTACIYTDGSVQHTAWNNGWRDTNDGVRARK